MSSIIPTIIPLFNEYIQTTNARQLAINPDTSNPYWTDYGWTNAESTEYDTRNTNWLALYALYANPLTVTSVIRDRVHLSIKLFSEFVHDQNLIDKIRICSIVTADDAAIFHFTLDRDDDPTHLSAQISGRPYGAVNALGSGDMDVKVRTATDSHRPSIDRTVGADSVRTAWVVADSGSTTGINPESLSKSISKKAHFIMNLGVPAQTKYLIAYFQWYNTSFPQYAGTWSPPVVMPIG